MTAEETGPAKAEPVQKLRAPRRGRWIGFALRLVITLVLLAALVIRLDMSESLTLVTSALIPTLIFGLALAFGTIVLNAIRWVLMVNLTGASLTHRESLAITLLGHFFNQFLPTSVGGDIVRGWEATRSGLHVKNALISIVLDRLAGLVALLLLIIVGQPFLIARIGNPAIATIAVVLPLFAFIGLTLVLFFDRLPLHGTRLPFVAGLSDLARTAKHLIRAPRTALYSLILSLGIHSLALYMTTVYAQALGADVGFADMLFVVPTVLLISSLPISIAGWGVREAGLAAGFAALGYPASVAVTVSILVGLTNAAIGLPGAIIWVVRRRRRPPASASES